ncbi:MAG: D-alanyl-D-alanine carboxypeptidase family protein [Tissierella sp.]|uniref:D-alanyl-D-alanine carboxypeptidase family protein n=1 Tax=Tissierella sp. TaxID=41274 RepID=UPI003F968A39
MKKIWKIVKLFVLVVALIFGVLFIKERFGGSITIFGDNYDSDHVYVLNRQDKNEVLKKDHKSKAYPASLTKIMTTIVALEHIEDLSTIAPIDLDTYREMVNNNSSMAGFYANEQTTYRDLLYGTILSSGGESANSLAVNIAGSVDEFVQLMNNKASELGLKDTNFTNPEGLHNKKQYTTAYDMAKLLDYALENGHFRAIFTKETFQTISTLDHPDGILLNSTVLSKLHGLSQNGFEIIGGKSGTTYEAGQCWATLVIKDGIEYIGVVMGSSLNDISNPSNKHIEDTIRVFEEIK